MRILQRTLMPMSMSWDLGLPPCLNILLWLFKVGEDFNLCGYQENSNQETYKRSQRL